MILIGPNGKIVEASDLENCFESLTHKFNFFRKYFAIKRQRGQEGIEFIYQYQTLMKICMEFDSADIVEAIEETTKHSRGNYFRFFAEMFYDEIMTGGWSGYFLKQKGEK